MNKYEKNKPVKTYEQTTLDDAIDEAKDTADLAGVTPHELKAVLSVIQEITTCPDCHAGTNALGKPLDCRTCNSTGRA